MLVEEIGERWELAAPPQSVGRASSESITSEGLVRR